MRSVPLRVFVSGALLAAGTLACSFGLNRATPAPTPIPVSTEAAGELENIITQAAGSAETGDVTVVVTEEQLTSYVALKLAEQPDAPFKDVQILLRDGQIVMKAHTTVQNFTVPAEIRLDVATNAEGGLDINVADADFGPMPVPASLLEAFSTMIDESLSGELGPQATGVRISNVVIGDGEMTITGTANP
jgi:hypothetical protein